MTCTYPLVPCCPRLLTLYKQSSFCARSCSPAVGAVQLCRNADCTDSARQLTGTGPSSLSASVHSERGFPFHGRNQYPPTGVCVPRGPSRENLGIVDLAGTGIRDGHTGIRGRWTVTKEPRRRTCDPSSDNRRRSSNVIVRLP